MPIPPLAINADGAHVAPFGQQQVGDPGRLVLAILEELAQPLRQAAHDALSRCGAAPGAFLLEPLPVGLDAGLGQAAALGLGFGLGQGALFEGDLGLQLFDLGLGRVGVGAQSPRQLVFQVGQAVAQGLQFSLGTVQPGEVLHELGNGRFKIAKINHPATAQRPGRLDRFRPRQHYGLFRGEGASPLSLADLRIHAAPGHQPYERRAQRGGLTSRQFIRSGLLHLRLGNDRHRFIYGGQPRAIAPPDEILALFPELGGA